ncbi:hypothetical protein HU200_041196 [Digitaria exilis]|uniref:Wall-associated receptor kinase galacturonan-binding domain-containing protein n=1 Tax=Digitaria exilis TaxID=1010633 RepID=A0A835B9W9_9POAL|nr:hypothetical protein HU200_041196 [Digitaria exilis]
MGLFEATTSVTWMLFLAAAVLPLPLLLAADTADGKGSNVPAGNCTLTMCGDVVVPYPFGTTAGCYLPGYNLTCNTSHTPPRLSLGDGTLQVMSISLENSTVLVVGLEIAMVESVGDDNIKIGVIERSYSVFISEEGWFHRCNVSGSASWSASEIPVVLGWAIVSNALSNETYDGNMTCPKDLGSTACHSSYSTCRDTYRLYGKKNYTKSYTCSCWDGYQGNPYLPDG